jgi:hypothetical protein
VGTTPAADEKIIWSRQNTLTCNDFKAEGRQFFRGNDAESCIDWDCTFKYQYNVVVVQAACNFNTKKSWFDAKHCSDRWLINHEQRHFDIGEAYIRLYRKKLSEIKTVKEGNIGKTIFGEMEKYLELSNAAQADYDNATQHGLNRTAQRQWNADIDSMLFANINYQSTLITLEIK